MTIPMPDSIIPANMPPGYPAYLAYVDGWRSKDADAVRAMFPGAKIFTLTVLGGSAVADGCDREPGDLSPASAAAWLRGRIRAGAWRPGLYDSRDDVPSTLGELAALGVQRGQIRILSAHYGQGEHICSPSACGARFTADGTQWTDSFAGVGGSRIDMSALADDFFGAPAPVPAQTVEVTVKLSIIRQGSSGQAVRNLQGLLVSHGYGYMIATRTGDVEQYAGVDGVFGKKTHDAMVKLQRDYKLTADGICGSQTWAALLA